MNHESTGIALWTQVVTGMEITKENSLTVPLNNKTWRERRREMERLGGPPLP
jgi:hypothetical protein